MSRLKLLSIALAILGITGATILIGWYGFGRIAAALLSVGGPGFALYAAWQALCFIILGIAWWAVVPPEQRRIPVFIWGRAVRDSAGACLPFSTVGGFMFGARAVAMHGIGAHAAAISTVVDLTAEFAAEILFLIFGLAILLLHGRDVTLLTPIGIGAGIVLITALLTLRLQRRLMLIFAKLVSRLLRHMAPQIAAREPISDTELAENYGHSGRIAAGTLLHLLGWFAKGAGNWIAFRILGAPISMADALAFEALVHAALASAVMIPGFAGVQEALYASFGALLGAAPEMALSVSLLRRARDLALGVPILLVWQWLELHRLRKRHARSSSVTR